MPMTVDYNWLILFCFVSQAAKDLVNNLEELGAEQVFPTGFGNENTVDSRTEGNFADFEDWKNHFIHYIVTGKILKQFDENSIKLTKAIANEDNGEELVESSSDNDDDDEDDADNNTSAKSKTVNGSGTKSNSGLVDLEDIGSVMNKAKNKIKEEKMEKANGILKDMVTPELRQVLTKQGYKLIGSHSGVKLCRWTKVCSIKKLQVTF